MYCDFLSGPADAGTRKQYVEALLKEIKEESHSYVNREVITVFIGGGTPSVLAGEEILRIMDALRENYVFGSGCEISMEVNPGTVTEEKAVLWKRAGINRISIGLQSADDRELQALGRIHNSHDFLETYEMLIKSGFSNINVDLMSAIPYQTLESYRQTLQKVTSLEPPPVHISAYSLIIEEGTPFYEECRGLPEEDIEREMYKITDDILSALGYGRYEISNYAKSGYECRHNKVYWQRGDYVGFGIGSASLIDNVRFHNCRDIVSYVNFYNGRELTERTSVKEDIQKLTIEEQMEEFMFLGLRMMQGVSVQAFEAWFGKHMDEVYPGIIDRFIDLGMLVRGYDGEEERIALTKQGIDVSNVVMAEFLLS